MDSEWRKRLDKARVLAWLARGKVTAGPEHPDSRWIAAIEAWYMDGDKRRLIALVRECVQPGPEIEAVARTAVADALHGDRTRARNSKPPALRSTLEWRKARSWRLRLEMKREWKRARRGENLSQAVADAVNAEWEKCVIPWRVPFIDKHKATERTVDDDAREVDKTIRR